MTTAAIIIATGAKYKRLGVPGEDKLTGHGVSFCATCDGALYRDQEIAMVGGGDNALTEILFLERFAKKIHLIHRRDQFRAAKYLQERVLEMDKVQVHWDTVVTECKGAIRTGSPGTAQRQDQGNSTLPVTGAFIAIGMVPNTAWLGDLLPLDKWGFILTDPAMGTPIPGVFAAGDVRSKWERQISTAVGDGTVAAIAVERYLETLKNG